MAKFIALAPVQSAHDRMDRHAAVIDEDNMFVSRRWRSGDSVLCQCGVIWTPCCDRSWMSKVETNLCTRPVVCLVRFFMYMNLANESFWKNVYKAYAAKSCRCAGSLQSLLFMKICISIQILTVSQKVIWILSAIYNAIQDVCMPTFPPSNCYSKCAISRKSLLVDSSYPVAR